MARIIFAGSPDFVLPYLDFLQTTQHQLLAVYTQPDRPAGRGRKLQVSAVKQWAMAHDIAVEQPLSLRDGDAISRFKAYGADLLLVVAYGLILPKDILHAPERGCANIHYSLLPRWRGAAPVIHALLAGDEKTGVCLMNMDEGLDTGDVYASADFLTDESSNAGKVTAELTELGVDLLRQNLSALLDGALTAKTQARTGACYAHKIKKSMASIDWSQSALDLARQVKAFNPWPVTFTYFSGERLRIWQAIASPADFNTVVQKELLTKAMPGCLLLCGEDYCDVLCGDGHALRLLKVQLPGGRVLQVRDFINAHQKKLQVGMNCFVADENSSSCC